MIHCVRDAKGGGAYYRVSTERQGRLGLGIDAQKADVARHVAAFGLHLIAEYTEVETGKRDTLQNRPELSKAIAHAKRSKATLLVAKMDRLTWSVYVTAEIAPIRCGLRGRR